VSWQVSLKGSRSALNDLILAATKDAGQDLAGVVIDGMRQPAWVAFVGDKSL
jgi:hypothetical protein